jgi:hypothetical protein
LVDEVAVDTATRGALKDDSKFKALRDTIKKCNKVLETMLVRRERKYTLFFRLVSPSMSDKDDILAMKKWNHKVEKAVGYITSDNPNARGDEDQSGAEDSDGEDDSSTVGGGSNSSVASGGTGSSSIGGMNNAFGRTLVPPPQNNVRTRRATPTPRLRQQNANAGGGGGGRGRPDAGGSSDASSVNSGISDASNNNNNQDGAAEDGYSANTVGARTLLAQAGGQTSVGGGDTNNNNSTPLSISNNNARPIKAKDELIDVIKGLKVEKEIQKTEGGNKQRK